MPNLTFLPLTVPEICNGSQNFKIRSRDPFLTFLAQFCISVVSTPGMNLHAKFDVFSYNRSRDKGGGSQNFIIRSRDPFPTCQWGVAGDPIFGFLDPDLPIHCITFIKHGQLRVVYIRAAALLRPFSRFLVQNVAGSRDL